MITLTINKADGSPYWTQEFNYTTECNAWLAEEQTRPYWDPTFTTVITGTDWAPGPAPSAQDLAILAGLNAQQKGAEVVALVYSINEANFKSGALTLVQFQAMLADTTLLNIERLLFNGSLQTALTLIRTLDTTYMTQDQINSIEAYIVATGLAT